MKNLVVFTCLFLSFISTNLFSQGYGESDDDEPSSSNSMTAEVQKKLFAKNGESNFEYCQIVGTSKLFSRKVNIEIDYGQQQTFFQNAMLKDEKNKNVSFNSMIDVLNYMGGFGWEFAQAYVITVGSQNVYHFLLKRKKVN